MVKKKQSEISIILFLKAICMVIIERHPLQKTILGRYIVHIKYSKFN